MYVVKYIYIPCFLQHALIFFLSCFIPQFFFFLPQFPVVKVKKIFIAIFFSCSTERILADI